MLIEAKAVSWLTVHLLTFNYSYLLVGDALNDLLCGEGGEKPG